MDKRFQKIRPLLKLEEFGRETSLFDILVDYYTIMYEDKKIAKMIQDVAISIFTKLSCRGVARVDFILKGKKLYVLEINTIPGMTENSLIPKSARAAGMSSSQLLDTIIKDAMR